MFILYKHPQFSPHFRCFCSKISCNSLILNKKNGANDRNRQGGLKVRRRAAALAAATLCK